MLFRASLLAALLATTFGAQAAGLGKLTVYSAIGQPLKAEVEVTASPDEMRSLTAKLASHEAFRDAGVEFMPALSGLQMSVTHPKKGQTVLKLATERPLNEPFLHFLVELNWTAGRMVREYTFLLDPPEMIQASRAASVVSPAAPVVTPLTAKPSAAPVAAPSAARAAPAEAGRAGTAADDRQQLVVYGDTLGKIARENKPDSVTLDQMLVALFNSNRDAFVGNNMNRLRAGKILRLPDAEEVAKVDPAQARKLVIGQAAEFNAYRRRLAEAAGAAPAVDAEPKQQASGLIKPRVEEKAPPPEAKDKLEVSRNESAKSAKTVGGANLEADLVAREKALREASERIGHLEKNIEGLKNLVEIKSQKGAQMQQESQAAQPAQSAPAQTAPAESKPAAPAPAAQVAEAPAPAVAPPAATEATAPAKPAEAPAEPAPAPKPAAKKPAAPPPPPPEAGFLEENPQILYGGGALAVILLGYAAYAARRKKKASAEPQLADLSTEMSAPADAGKTAPVFGAPSETVDNGEVSIQGDFSDGGMLTTEEKVDPVAEADVLMAYGRDRQAEEILLEGLRQDPQRTAIHMKLLELYSKQENLAQFEKVATELHGLTGGRGSDWDKTDALARKLGLVGGIFLGAGAVTASEAPAEAVQAPPSAGKVEAEPVADEESEAANLDFDLDLGTTSAPPAAAEPEQSVPAEAPAPAAEEAMSLDFDFDLGSPTPAEAPAEVAAPVTTASAAEGGVDFSIDLDAAATPEVTLVAAADTGGGLDFDLDVGSEDKPADVQAVEPAASVAASDHGGMDIDFDLELGSGQEAAVATPAVEALVVPEVTAEPEAAVALDLADISLDLEAGVAAPAPAEESVELPSLELPAAQEAAAPAASSAEKPVAPFAAMDLPDIELSLDSEEVAAPALELPPLDVPEAAAPVAVSSEPDNPEVTTKLELAQAYEEMGDREGARDLLNEVLSEGSAAQQAQARMRLDQLGI